MSEETRGRGRGPTDEELRAAVPRDKSRREVRVGVFVVLGFVAVMTALFLLTDPAALRGRYMLITAVDDAGGIRRGDPVLMKGVTIGRVRAFEMVPSGEVDISMEIEGEWGVPEDSRTRLVGVGLLGGRTMEIIRGVSTEMAEAGDTLPGESESGNIMESAERVTEKAESVLGSLDRALDAGTVNAVRGSASEMQSLLVELRGMAALQRSQLATLTASLNRSAAGLEASGPAAALLIARADSAAIGLNRTTATLDRATASLESVLARMDAGEGTLGRLSRDDSLYLSLNRAASEIAALAEDIRLNPRKYVNLEIF